MMKSWVVAFISVIFLEACSTDSEQANLDLVSSYLSSEPTVAPIRFTSLFDEPRPVLDIEFIDLGVAGKLILEQQDGPYARYLSADLGGIVLQSGLLHSLYGFGEPLVGAELTQSLSLILAGRSGVAHRFHTYVDGEDRAQRRTYLCEISVAGSREVVLETGAVHTTLMSERCVNLDQSFENLYWVDQSEREVIQSRQWVGPNVGNFVTRVTKPY